MMNGDKGEKSRGKWFAGGLSNEEKEALCLI